MTIVETGFPSETPGESNKRLVTEGPTLAVDVGFDAEYDHRQAKPPRPHSQQIQALIDTGASASCIDVELASKIGLPVVNRTSMAGISGLQACDVYAAQIHAPPFGFTLYGKFFGVYLAASGLPHAVLLGRDFLQTFVMIYDGPRAQVTLIR